MDSPRKLILIGLDGGTFRVLRPLMRAGVMPTLTRFIDEGASGVLLSTRPPVTCPAWPTMFTGVNPGKHSVFSFSFRDAPSGRVRTASSTDVQIPAIWDLLSRIHRRVVILNVPITFPATSVNGAMLTGFVSPEGSPHVAKPESLSSDLRRQFTDLSLNWSVLNHRPRGARRREAHIRRINELMRLRNAQVEYVLSKFDADFCFVVYEYPDRVQHLFYHLLDPACSAHRLVANQAALDLLRQGFRELDAALASLVDRFGESANYVVVSDHGFDAVTRWVYVNNLLEKHGLLVTSGFKVWADLITRWARTPNVVRSWVGLEQGVAWHRHDPFKAPLVNYAKTAAFAGPQLEHAVYVNLKGRCPSGTVEPGRAYEQVRRAVIEVLTQAVDSRTGKKVFEGVWPREKVFWGKYLERAPDLVYELAPGYMASNATLPKGLLAGQFLRNIGPGWDISGYHRPEGILIGWGPDFRAIQDIRASIVDIAPTLLYLLGLPAPMYMDGRVVEAALRPQLLRSRRPQISESSSLHEARAEGAYTVEEEREVARQLEELGYL